MGASRRERVEVCPARRVGREFADDVVSEVFVVAWRKPEEAWDLPWLYGVARRIVATHQRGRTRRSRLRLRVLQNERVMGQTEERTFETVYEALRELADEDQELLRLIVWEELGVGEAGRALGIAPAAARMRLTRARQRFREAYERAQRQRSGPERVVAEGSRWMS